MFFVAVSQHHVSHVHVINLSSSAGNRGRKSYKMYMGNMMLRHRNKEHVFLPRKKDL
jgi:hypothetical protein